VVWTALLLFFVVEALRNLARDGRTVLASVHQPSSEVFELFDYLYLLSGGQTMYFGEAKMAQEFFAQAGFACPRTRNPADLFLCCINSDFDKVKDTLKGSFRHHEVMHEVEVRDLLLKVYSAQAIRILTETFQSSEYALIPLCWSLCF
jgi:ABC-type multidrug transport system ATPase subunit